LPKQLKEEFFMRRLILCLLLVATIANSGCIIPMYSGDPQRRARQLLFSSEDLRLLLDDWERLWMIDQPTHLTPFRTHGGVI
jgi:hypothetical protein